MKMLTFSLTKYAKTTFILATILFFGMSLDGFSQNNETIYTTVSLMKVKQGNAGKYLNVEQDIWKPVHQELVKQGKILGWYLYQIQYTGTGDEYNYATVTHYRGSENLGGGYSDELFENVHPNMPSEYISEETQESRDLVTSRLLQWVLQSFPEEQREPSRYAVVNYQKSIPGMNYFALRQDYVKPAFDLAVKEDQVAGWGLWSLMFPSGADMPFNWVSADFYNEFDKIGNFAWEDLIRRANPNQNMDEILPKFGPSRTMVRSELWRLIDYTH